MTNGPIFGPSTEMAEAMHKAVKAYRAEHEVTSEDVLFAAFLYLGGFLDENTEPIRERDLNHTCFKMALVLLQKFEQSHPWLEK